MVGRSKRKIYKSGSGANLLTVPKEWAEQLKDKNVHVIFDNILMVFPSEKEEDVEEIMEKLLSQYIDGEIKETTVKT